MQFVPHRGTLFLVHHKAAELVEEAVARTKQSPGVEGAGAVKQQE
jgi:hypothetical protein